MKKRLFAMILCAAMMLSLVVGASADLEFPGGSIPDTQLSWSVLGDVLKINGFGMMPNYESASETPWAKYASRVQSIEISTEVTYIGKYAFAGLNACTSVSIAGTVCGMGAYAFSGSNAITAVEFRGTQNDWNFLQSWDVHGPYGYDYTGNSVIKALVDSNRITFSPVIDAINLGMDTGFIAIEGRPVSKAAIPGEALEDCSPLADSVSVLQGIGLQITNVSWEYKPPKRLVYGMLTNSEHIFNSENDYRMTVKLQPVNGYSLKPATDTQTQAEWFKNHTTVEGFKVSEVRINDGDVFVTVDVPVKKPIHTTSLSGLPLPVAGETPVIDVYPEEGAHYCVKWFYWTDEDGDWYHDPFVENQKYSTVMVLEPDEGYIFWDMEDVTLENFEIDTRFSGISCSATECEYRFTTVPCTAKLSNRVISIGFSSDFNVIAGEPATKAARELNNRESSWPSMQDALYCGDSKISCSVNRLVWYDAETDTLLRDGDCFQEGEAYYAVITLDLLEPDNSQIGVENIEFTSSYLPDLAPASVEKNANSQLRITTNEILPYIPIHNVKVLGIRQPLLGEEAQTEENLSIPENAHYKIRSFCWTESLGSENEDPCYVFEDGKEYMCTMEIVPDDGYIFWDYTVAVENLHRHRAMGGGGAFSHTFVSADYAAGRDLNGDGFQTAADLTILARHVAKITEIKDQELLWSVNLNDDNEVNSLDLTLYAMRIAAPE